MGWIIFKVIAETAFYVLLSIASFAVGWRWAKSRLERPRYTVPVLVVAFALFFFRGIDAVLFLLHAQLLLGLTLYSVYPYVLPATYASAFVLGWLYSKYGHKTRLRVDTLILLSVWIVTYFYMPFLYVKEIPRYLRMEPRWVSGRVARQTTGFTCSPSAGATLLAHYGIETTEGEMAIMMQTTAFGTYPVHEMIALSRKGREGKLKVYPRVVPLGRLAALKYPASIAVRLKTGTMHSIAVLGSTAEGEIVVGDPLHGIVVLSEDEFAEQYDYFGHAFVLAPAGSGKTLFGE